MASSPQRPRGKVDRSSLCACKLLNTATPRLPPDDGTCCRVIAFLHESGAAHTGATDDEEEDAEPEEAEEAEWAAWGEGAGNRLQRARLMDEPSTRGHRSRQMHIGKDVDVDADAEEEAMGGEPTCGAAWTPAGGELALRSTSSSRSELHLMWWCGHLLHVIGSTWWLGAVETIRLNKFFEDSSVMGRYTQSLTQTSQAEKSGNNWKRGGAAFSVS